MKFVVKSKKFILRPFRIGDELSLMKNINNKKIYRMVSHIPYPYTLKDAKKWISLNLKEYDRNKISMINFVIDMNGEVVGSIGIQKIKRNHKGEIGYWLAERYWNNGIMTEALKLITKFGFNMLKLKRLELKTHLSNKASQRIAEKAGYKFNEILMNDVKRGGKFLNAFLFFKIK